MKRCSLKRRKAFLGETLAAAGITAAASLAAAGMQASATNKAAKQQADATVKAAQQQASALNAQNENNNMLQQQSIDFTKQENETNRELQKEAQLNVQMALGQQQLIDQKDQNRIQVKRGGKVKAARRLANQNLPFKVTDGGGVIPLENIDNGTLYAIVGDNHEQSHRTPGGSRKTGVGFKFANGQVVEGEGNGNTDTSELLYYNYDDDTADFISKHTINGYNPAQDVLNGTDPRIAALRQAFAKKSQNKRNKAIYGQTVIEPNVLMPGQSFQIDNSTINDMMLGQTTNKVPIAKRGCRVKAKDGFWQSPFAGNLIGAGISSLGNLGGAFINMWGNNAAARALSEAYGQSSNILTEAYEKLHGIDPSIISDKDFKSAHAIPALMSTVVRNSADREAVARAAREAQRKVNRTTLSGAAQYNRMNSINDRYGQQLAAITQAEGKESATRRAANMDAANKAILQNAYIDSQDLKNNLALKLDLAKYNNDIENTKITGAAQVQSDALLGSAGARSSAYQSTGRSFGNALGAIGNSFGNAISSAYKQKQDDLAIYAGMDPAARSALEAQGYHFGKFGLYYDGNPIMNPNSAVAQQQNGTIPAINPNAGRNNREYVEGLSSPLKSTVGNGNYFDTEFYSGANANTSTWNPPMTKEDFAAYKAPATTVTPVVTTPTVSKQGSININPNIPNYYQVDENSGWNPLYYKPIAKFGKRISIRKTNRFK